MKTPYKSKEYPFKIKETATKKEIEQVFSWLDSGYQFSNEVLKSQNPLQTLFQLVENIAFKYPQIKSIYNNVFYLDEVFLNTFSLVELSKKTGVSENDLFKLEERIQSALICYISENIELIKQVHHIDFEFLVAELISNLGYKVEVSKATKDGGYDLFAISNNIFKTKHLIECKKYKDKIGVSIIRELLYVVDSKNANQGIIVTNSYFTKDSKIEKQKNEHKLELVDFDTLKKWIIDYKKQVNNCNFC